MPRCRRGAERQTVSGVRDGGCRWSLAPAVLWLLTIACGTGTAPRVLAEGVGPAAELTQLQEAIDRAQDGNWRGAADVVAGLDDARARHVALVAIRQRTLHQVASRPGQVPPSAGDRTSPAAGASGGGSQADFTALVNLIQDTVAPDSWQENGLGDGAIVPFPAGVWVDVRDRPLARVAAVPTKVEEEPAGSLERDPPSLTSPHTTHKTYATRNHSRKTRAGKLRAVSLNRLERQIAYHWALQEPIPPSALNLAGLRRIHAVACFPAPTDQEAHAELVRRGDVVLIGSFASDEEGSTPPPNDSRPPLRLDDLVVHFRHAQQGSAPFGCSIDPLPENLARTQAFLERSSQHALAAGTRGLWLKELKDHLGQQQVSVFGVAASTRVAQVLVEADYHMKQVAMGLAPGPTPRFSYLEQVTSSDAEPWSVLRWWFSLDFAEVFRSPDDLAWGWRGQGVVVRGENEHLADHGERQHTGKISPRAADFARRFTEQFAALAKQYPIYADMQNQFGWALAMQCVVEQQLPERAGWHPTHFAMRGAYQPEPAQTPDSVPSIVNHRSLGSGVLIAGVSGGVRAELPAWNQRSHEETSEGPGSQRLGQIYQAATPPSTRWQQWWWDLTY